MQRHTSEHPNVSFGEPVADTWIFEKEIGLLSKCSLIEPRTGHCLIPLNGSAFLISGVISHVQPTTQCSKYDYFADTWHPIASISKPRILAAGCCLGNIIYITGGNPGNSLQNYRDIEKYSILNNNWEYANIKIPMDIWRHTCLPHKNGLIIFGGNGNRSLNLDCFKIDLIDNVVIQHTWLTQGGEFQGCNFGGFDKVYAFETTTSLVVWMFSHGKWSSKINKLNGLFKQKNTMQL